MNQYTVSYKTTKINGVKKMTATVYMHGVKLVTLTHPEFDKVKPFVNNYMRVILSMSDQAQVATFFKCK